MKTIFFDIETDALLDDMTLVHCIGVAEDDGKTEAYGPDDLEAGVDRLLTAERLVGHNIIGFDIPALMINDTSFLRNPNYHQMSDDIDTLSFDHMTEVVTAAYKAITGF